jgi:hypothetical protein
LVNTVGVGGEKSDRRRAFAFDLRLLRTKAGDPSYRKLAQRAGVSALSAAAGGAVLVPIELDADLALRMPSHEVTASLPATAPVLPRRHPLGGPAQPHDPI